MARFLRRASGKRQQSDIARLLDRRTQTALVRCTHSRKPARRNLAAFRHKLRKQSHVFVIDRCNFFGAELAHFFAAEVLATAAGGADALRFASLIALILSRRFCSSSIRTLRNLITGSVTRRRRSSSCTSPPPPSNVSR